MEGQLDGELRLLNLLESRLDKDQRKYYGCVLRDRLDKSVPMAIIELIAEMASAALCIGTRIDVQDKAGWWNVGEVVAVNGEKLIIHYQGWHKKWDEEFSYSSPRIKPLFTELKPQPVRIPLQSEEGRSWSQERITEMARNLRLSLAQAKMLSLAYPSQKGSAATAICTYLYWREFGGRGIDEQTQEYFNKILALENANRDEGQEI
jgi:hypothetical protein